MSSTWRLGLSRASQGYLGPGTGDGMIALIIVVRPAHGFPSKHFEVGYFVGVWGVIPIPGLALRFDGHWKLFQQKARRLTGTEAREYDLVQGVLPTAADLCFSSSQTRGCRVRIQEKES